MTVMPNWGSWCSPAISSRVARSMGATSRCTSPSSGVAAASSSLAASATCSGEPSPNRTSARSVLWAIPSPPNLTTTGYPISPAAPTASSTPATTRSSGNGTPNALSSSLEATSERVGMTGQTTCATRAAR
jgi:hypothetical protein